MNAKNVLIEYAHIYKGLKQILLHENTEDNIICRIRKIELIANFAWHYHPGMYADGELEGEIWNLGKLIPDQKNNQSKLLEGDRRRVLHIASEVYTTGGHTRLLLNVIKNDKNSVHSLIIVRQGEQVIPTWLIDSIKESGGDIHIMNENDSIKKIENIRKILQNDADFIFLHIHPDDVLSLVAIATENRPPTVFVNHADHVFSLGISLSDSVACIRKWSAEFSMQRRFAKKTHILPIPLNFDVNLIYSKNEARQNIGILDEDILLISVATSYKFTPDKKYNYFRLINDVVNKYKNVRVKIIGVSQEDAERVGYILNEHVELLGLVENPLQYYIAADIYVDSMPFSSFTSLWEAAFFKSLPILQYAPADKMILENEPAIQQVIVHARDELKWKEQIGNAIENKLYRDNASEEIAFSIKEFHSGKGWNDLLYKIYYDIKSSTSYNYFKDVVEISSDDIDSAQLSDTFNMHKINYLSPLIHNYIRFLSFKEIIKTFPYINYAQGGQSSTSRLLRACASLLKAKILSNNIFKNKNA